VGLIQEPLAPLDGGLQLLDHPPESTGGLGLAASQGPAGATHDPAGVGQLRLGQAGDLPGDLEHDLLGLARTRPQGQGNLVDAAAPPADGSEPECAWHSRLPAPAWW
jgi:hypothetical protein